MTNSPLVTSYAFEEITEHTSDTNAVEDSEHDFQMIIALSASTSNKKKTTKRYPQYQGKIKSNFLLQPVKKQVGFQSRKHQTDFKSSVSSECFHFIDLR